MPRFSQEILEALLSMGVGHMADLARDGIEKWFAREMPSPFWGAAQIRVGVDFCRQQC
jgi:hypothetical protein